MSKYKLVPVVLSDIVSDVLFNAIRNGDADCLTTETVYAELLQAAPEVPKLTDARIREIWIKHLFDWVGFARAIERELLGENENVKS